MRQFFPSRQHNRHSSDTRFQKVASTLSNLQNVSLIMGEKITDTFLQLFIEKNSDGTRHLRLKGNELQQRISYRLKARDMHKVAAFMKERLCEIISVDLSYNNIGDRGMQILCEEFFNEDNNLQHINLMQCSIEAEGVRWLAVSEFLKLKSCRLSGNPISYTGARWIASLIQNCPTLQDINIAETEQIWESLESILIVCEQSNLKCLDISRILPRHQYLKLDPALIADELAVVVKLNQNLVELHTQKCCFDGHDIDILVDGLKLNKSLQVLDLGYNGMGDLGAQSIANWLKTRPALRALILAGNRIKELGARALSFGVPFSKVRYLDLSSNLINDVGLCVVLDRVKKSCPLRFLFLWGNQIGPISLKRMERMFQSGILEQEYFDIKLYTVDDELCPAYYPADHYKHKYYCVMDHGCAVELKIKRNKIHHPGARPRELVKYNHVARFPPIDQSLGFKKFTELECPVNDDLPDI